MEGVTIALTWMLAAVFAVAAVAKLADRASFERVLRGIVDRSTARALSWACPLIEAALALWLWTGATGRAAAAAALAVLGASSLVLWQLARAGRAADCRCFGALSSASPRRGLARNGALGTAAAALLVTGAGRPASLAEAIAALTLVAGLACLWTVGAALAEHRAWLGAEAQD